MTVGVGSFGVASAAFLGLAAFVCLGWIGRHWAIIGLIVTTLVWAATGCWFALEGRSDPSIYDLLDFARSIALLFLVNDALHRLSGGHRDGRWSTEVGILVPTTAIVALVLGVLRLIDVEDAFFFSLIGHVAIAVIGLFLIENLFQLSRPNSLWTTKHLLIGAGTIFAFDLFFYTEALLFLRPDEMTRNVQPIIAVLAMPLLLISARRLNDVLISLPVSRGLFGKHDSTSRFRGLHSLRRRHRLPDPRPRLVMGSDLAADFPDRGGDGLASPLVFDLASSRRETFHRAQSLHLCL
ncbi:MAG: hypothetical protein ACR2QF_06385 [Geminicoccaceae bacterium]